MFKRIIKDDKNYKSKDIVTVPINNKILHPITLDVINTNGFLNPICLTKMYISNNKLNNYSNYICNGENKYKVNIQLPPIALNSSDLLEIYNINNIDSLIEWINTNIVEYNFYTFSRVISCWIIDNPDTLKTYKKHIINICNKLLSNYSPEIKNINISISDEINLFINNWIDEYKIDDNSNLLNILIKKFILKN